MEIIEINRRELEENCKSKSQVWRACVFVEDLLSNLWGIEQQNHFLAG